MFISHPETMDLLTLLEIKNTKGAFIVGSGHDCIHCPTCRKYYYSLAELGEFYTPCCEAGIRKLAIGEYRRKKELIPEDKRETWAIRLLMHISNLYQLEPRLAQLRETFRRIVNT
jgi:hypothetical protein